MMPSLERDTVVTFVRLLRALPEASEDEFLAALQASGMDLPSAERVYALVPMAFARVLLQGAAFPETYLIRDPGTGKDRRMKLRREPIFNAALALAGELGKHHPDVALVGGCSAEVRAARPLLQGGSGLANIRFTEAVTLRMTPEPRKAWWRWW